MDSLIRKLIFIVLVPMLLSADIPDSVYRWKEMASISFEMSPGKYESETIYFNHVILDADQSVIDPVNYPKFSFEDYILPLDIYDDWGSAGEDQYKTLFTKTVYKLATSVDFFTKERLSDVAYLSETMPDVKLHFEDSTYHLSMGFGIPEIEYKLYFFNEKSLRSKWPALANYLLKYDQSGDLKPRLTVLQHNFNYGKVMFQKTSKMSISVTRYYDLGAEQTLVMNYTLNYIHNMPPDIVGGQELLVKKIREGIEALVFETQKLADAQP